MTIEILECMIVLIPISQGRGKSCVNLVVTDIQGANRNDNMIKAIETTILPVHDKIETALEKTTDEVDMKMELPRESTNQFTKIIKGIGTPIGGELRLKHQLDEICTPQAKMTNVVDMTGGAVRAEIGLEMAPKGAGIKAVVAVEVGVQIGVETTWCRIDTEAAAAAAASAEKRTILVTTQKVIGLTTDGFKMLRLGVEGLNIE